MNKEQLDRVTPSYLSSKYVTWKNRVTGTTMLTEKRNLGDKPLYIPPVPQQEYGSPVLIASPLGSVSIIQLTRFSDKKSIGLLLVCDQQCIHVYGKKRAVYSSKEQALSIIQDSIHHY